MFIKTESGAILNWDAISKVVIEPSAVPVNAIVPATRQCKVVAYMAQSNSPVLISSCDVVTARQIMDVIEEALKSDRTYANLGSIFAKRQLARRIDKQIVNTDNQ